MGIRTPRLSGWGHSLAGKVDGFLRRLRQTWSPMARAVESREDGGPNHACPSGNRAKSGGDFRQEGRNVLEFLTRCSKAHLEGQPTPSLIPPSVIIQVPAGC